MAGGSGIHNSHGDRSFNLRYDPVANKSMTEERTVFQSSGPCARIVPQGRSGTNDQIAFGPFAISAQMQAERAGNQSGEKLCKLC